MNYSFLAGGRRPKMKSKESPWFFVKIILQITNPFLIAGDTKISCFLAEGVIFLDKTDKKGGPKGATHAAYVK